MYPEVYVWVCISRVGCAELAKRIISRSMRFVSLSTSYVFIDSLHLRAES